MKTKDKQKDKTSIQLGWDKKQKSENPLGFNIRDPGHETGKKKKGRRAWELTNSESHLLTIAPTGSGKGRSVIIPTCLSWPGSLVVIDPKGEAAAVTARKRKELGNQVVMIDPFGIATKNPASFNPFDILPFTDMSVEEFSLLFPGLLHPDRDYSMLREPFWDLRGDEIIAGVAAYVLEALPKEERNISTLRKLLKSGDVIYDLAVLLDTRKQDMPPMAYENISSFISTEDKCRSGILATAQQHFSIFADPAVEECLGSTSFDIGRFKDGTPMTIYLVLPTTRLYSHQPLLRIWMSSIIALLKSRTTRPEIATLLMIDEAAQLGRMSALLECVTLLRGYGVRTWTFWQSKNQIDRIYGLDADVILDNCGVVQTFGTNNHQMAESLTKLLGQKYTSEELLTLPGNEQLILTPAGQVQQIQKLDYLKDRKYTGEFDPNPLYNRGKPEVNRQK